jgi:hypothetical protein
MSHFSGEAVLLVDVFSVKGQQIYGRKSDRVQVIADQGDVLIVEGSKWVEEEKKTGKIKGLIKSGIHRYPVSRNDVSL